MYRESLIKIINLPSILIDYIQHAFVSHDKKKTTFYRLDSTKKNELGEVVVYYKTIYTGKLLHCKLEKLTSERDDILSGFDITDIKTIISLANKNYNTKIEVSEKGESKLLILFSVLFVSAFLISNIAASKIGVIYGIPVTGAVFIRPFIYIFGSIITEVYGYKKIRAVIWGTLLCNIFMVMALWAAILIPQNPVWHTQSEYSLILGSVPRVVLASMTAFFVGEFVNSYVLARIKLWTKGSNLLFRIITSSVVAISIDTALFVTIAYGFTFSMSYSLPFTLRVYFTKLFFDLVCYPIIGIMCAKVKKYEKLDIFDIKTNFTPFSMDITYKQ